MIKTCDPKDPKYLKLLFSALDVDGSGYLDKKELMGWLQIVTKLGGMSPELLDVYGPGFFERLFGPKRTALEVCSFIVQNLFKVSDTNHDGKISLEEFETFGQ